MTQYFNSITLYQDTPITPAKNFKIDNIDTYLAGFPSLTSSVAQYTPFALNLKIKVNTLDQTDLDYASQKYNYCMIRHNVQQEGGSAIAGKRYFYFILNQRWVSSSCVELELKLDTLNTLGKMMADSGSFMFVDDRTMILREHKNRWKGGTYPGGFDPVIDMYSEGISPVLFKTKEHTLYQNLNSEEAIEDNFYLIYTSTEQGDFKAVDVFLCGDSSYTVDLGSSGWSGTFNARSLGGQSAVIYGSDGISPNTNVGMTMNFKSRDGNESWSLTASNQCILITKNWACIGYVDSNGFHASEQVSISSGNARRIEITGLFKMRVSSSNLKKQSTWGTITSSYITNLPVATEYVPPVNQTEQVLSIIDVDRTDAKIQKIVKLPYCPITLDDSNGVLYLPAGWEVATFYVGNLGKMIHLRKNQEPVCLESQIGLDNYNIDGITPWDKIKTRPINFGDDVERSDVYETKLLNSDYYLVKFVYDSFSYDFRYELLDVDVDRAGFYVDFFTSLNMSSSFMFRIYQNYFEDMKYDVNDYSNVIYVSRNNELVLYNSSYLNYIRNGYNYDQKTRNRNLALGIAGLSLGTISSVAGFVSGMGEKSKAENIASAVQMGAGILKNTFNLIGQTAQADQNIDQKLRTSIMQGVSVAGADDLDLMSAYTENDKAKLCFYEVSPKMKKVLFDLFYYTGYVANYQGIPNENTRLWFNFVQADLLMESTQNVPQEVLEDYKEKYRDGITIFHRNGWQGNYVWDIPQEKENWEKSLMPRVIQDVITSIQTKVEYVVKTDLSNISDIARLTKNGKLIWRLRQKSNMCVIAKETGLDTFTIKGNATPKAIDVGVGSTLHQEITFANYDQDNFYWTIEFEEYSGGGYNQSIALSCLYGYVSQ